MSSNVQLVTVIGDQTIRVGTCHPGQARILVKKGHAAWKDGVLSLYLRPIHLQVAENTRRLLGDEEAHEVSNAEVERRLAWLRKIMESVVQTDTHGSDLEAIAGPQGERDPRDGLRHIHQVIQEAKGRDAFCLTHSGIREEDLPGLLQGSPPPDLTEEELAEWFSDESEPESNLTFEEMTAIWDRPKEHGDWFYSKLGQPDSRKAPIRVEEPPALREPDEADGVTLSIHAAVIGEADPKAEFIKTDFDRWREETDELPVRFTVNQKRSKNAKWPDPEDVSR